MYLFMRFKFCSGRKGLDLSLPPFRNEHMFCLCFAVFPFVPKSGTVLEQFWDNSVINLGQILNKSATNLHHFVRVGERELGRRLQRTVLDMCLTRFQTHISRSRSNLEPHIHSFFSYQLREENDKSEQTEKPPIDKQRAMQQTTKQTTTQRSKP